MTIIDGSTSRPLTLAEEFAYNTRRTVEAIHGWFPGEKRRRALNHAIEHGDGPGIKQLLRGHPGLLRRKICIVNKVPAWTPLEAAIQKLSWPFDDDQKNGKASAAAIAEAFPEALLEKDAAGQTLLHRFCGQGRCTVSQIETLCEIGADVSARDNAGAAPLHTLAGAECSSFDFSGILALLLKHGAQLEARDDAGRTPLMYAAGGDKTCSNLKLLLESGAAVDARDKAGLTATMLAVHAGATFAVKLLLQHGGALDFGDAATAPFCAPLEAEPEWSALIAPRRADYEIKQKEMRIDAAVKAVTEGLDHDVSLRPTIVLAKKIHPPG